MAAFWAVWKSLSLRMVSAVISGASPESTMTWSYLLPESASRATMSACPVPRCSACSTKFTPVPATASRTRSASWPMITKMSSRGHDLFRRGNHMRQDRLAADFMQNLGMFRFEPRAFARRHNRDGDARRLRIGSERFRLGLRFCRFCHAQPIYREVSRRDAACRVSREA